MYKISIIKKAIYISIFSIFTISCSNAKNIIKIYESGDTTKFKKAMFLLLEDSYIETKEGKDLLSKLKEEYLAHKKKIILHKYKDTRISYIKRRRLYTSDLQGNNEIEYGYFDRGKDYKWSPNGNYIAFNHDYPEEISIIDLESKRVKQLTNDTDRSYTPSWSDDSTKLIYSLAYELIEVNIETNEKKVIEDLNKGYILYPHYINNNEIIYLYNNKLHILNTKTDNTETLIFDENVSNDFRVLKLKNELIFVPSDNLFSIDPGEINISLSNDKAMILTNKILVSIKDRTRMNIMENISYNVSWSYDDKFILYCDRNDNLYIKDLNEDLPLKGLDIMLMKGVSKPSWSPILHNNNNEVNDD